jgi:hypothetical protein
MTGSASACANVVICSPGSPANGAIHQIGQYDIVNMSYAGIVWSPSSNAGNYSVVQAGNVTVMRWYRGVNNGNANDAQVTVGGVTNVIWAIGAVNAFAATPVPNMGNTPVSLLPEVYANTQVLTSGLVLNWIFDGSLFTFQAVLSQLAWCVAVSVLLCGMCACALLL